MTYLEKAAQKYPLFDINSIVSEMCPDDMHLEKKSPCKGLLEANAAMDTPGVCLKCWSREVPHE